MKFCLFISSSLIYLSSSIVAASSCACSTVADFDDLELIVRNALSASVPLLRLCPFKITKMNVRQGIQITAPIHIMCAKETRNDECFIEGMGVSTNNSKTYQPFWWENVDNVTLQGLHIANVNNGAITAAGQNFKIIDCIFDYSQSPPLKAGSIVRISPNSSATIIDSTFAHNKGGAVGNYGKLTVAHSEFINNESTPVWLSNDSTENRGGGTGGAILNGDGGNLMVYASSFVDNISDKAGPAIWSYQSESIDLGSNCGNNNRVVDINTDEILGYCDGIFYKFTHENKGNLCASFRSSC